MGLTPTRALLPLKDDPSAAPWNWSWMRWRVGEGWTFFWILWLHLWAILGIVLTPLPGWTVFAIALSLLLLGGWGTTVCYHRTLAHKALKLNPVVEFILTVFAIFNGSGTPATWTANHRHHHSSVETPDDISSPRVGGFWWSHLRWLYQAPPSEISRWCPELDSPYYRWWTRWQVRILAVSFLAGLALVPFLGWAAFFWLGPIRLCYALHAQCFVNSVAHMKKDVATGADSSQNLLWLGFVQFFGGENWHGNHHTNPSSARLGWTWRQPDHGWWVVQVLEAVGLASDVRRPRFAGG